MRPLSAIWSNLPFDILLIVTLVLLGSVVVLYRARRRGIRRRTDAALAVARALVDSEDPGAGLCAAARELTGADHALLTEPDDEARCLRVRAAAGPPVEVDAIPLDDSHPSLAAIAFTTRDRIFVRDARRDPRSASGPVRRAGAVAVLAQPVLRADRVVGVLVLTWDRAVPLQDDTASLVELLAASGALALERSRLLAQAERAARTDALTGLANRRVWDRALPREIARAARQDTPVSVALLDLDHFKAYNDTHGHQAGDRLLRRAAEAWAECLRTTDLLARYGGEEFAVVLPGTPLHEAADAADRLRAGTPDGQTCSAGVAQWDGQESPESLLARADRALYAAKAAGRDRTGIDDPDHRRQLSERRQGTPPPSTPP